MHDDLDEIKALKNEKNSLETLYQGWMDSDLNINQLLEDNTDEIVAELAEEYKAKQSKKKSKEYGKCSEKKTINHILHRSVMVWWI